MSGPETVGMRITEGFVKVRELDWDGTGIAKWEGEVFWGRE